jgi:hypothetical protein
MSINKTIEKEIERFFSYGDGRRVIDETVTTELAKHFKK